MTSSVVVLTSLLLLVATAWSRDDADTVEYRLTEESPAGTLVGDLLRDLPSLAAIDERHRLHFTVVTTSSLTTSSATSHVLAQFTVGDRDGRLMTSSPVDREGACPQRDVTDCVIRLDVAVRPLAVFRLIRVAVTILDINDHAPVFSTTRYIPVV